MSSHLVWGALAVLAVISASWFSGLGSLSNPVPATGDISPVMPVQSSPAQLSPNQSSGPVSSRSDANTLAPLSTDRVTGLALTDTFREADMDGRLWAGPDGHLIVDQALRYWFDGWLSLQGEWPLDRILAAMQERFRALGEPASTEAGDVLQTYLNYRQALSEYDDRTGRSVVESDTSVLAQRLEWVERLRREYFSESVVTAFFGDDETLDRHLLARRQLQLQGAPAAELQSLEQSLPADLQRHREQSQSLRNMHQQEQAWQQQNLDADALAKQKYQYRASQWGEAAARRLATLDQQHQGWQQRIADYAQYRRQQFEGVVESNISDEKREALNGWLQHNFSEQELKRVPAALDLYLSQENPE